MSIQASVAAAMNTLNLSSVGRTVGLGLLVAQVRETVPGATRDEVWSAAAAVTEHYEEGDDITYEDCADPVWGRAGYDC